MSPISPQQNHPTPQAPQEQKEVTTPPPSPKFVSVGTQTDHLNFPKVLEANSQRFKRAEPPKGLLGKAITPVRNLVCFVTSSKTQEAVLSDITVTLISGVVLSAISVVGIKLWETFGEMATWEEGLSFLKEKSLTYLGWSTPPPPPPSMWNLSYWI